MPAIIGQPVTALSVIIPAFNEAVRLPRTLSAVHAFLCEQGQDGELLVVDDGSTDDTAALVTRFADARPPTETGNANVAVCLLRSPANRGKGHAVRTGMLAAGGALRLFCDADLATPMSEYAALLAAMRTENAQVAIGSRPLRQSELLVHQPLYRELLGRGFNRMVQMMGVPGIMDTQCGFKLWTADAAQSVFSRCRLDGFAFDVEALYVARKLGFRIAEVPVRWAHQPGSKVSVVRDGGRMILDMARVRRLHAGLAPTATFTAPPQPSATPPR